MVHRPLPHFPLLTRRAFLSTSTIARLLLQWLVGLIRNIALHPVIEPYPQSDWGLELVLVLITSLVATLVVAEDLHRRRHWFFSQAHALAVVRQHRFLGQMAHELRNALTGVTSFVQGWDGTGWDGVGVGVVGAVGWSTLSGYQLTLPTPLSAI